MEHLKITETELWEYISKKANNLTIQKVEEWIDSAEFDETLFTEITNLYKHTSTQNPSVEQSKKRFFKTVKPKTIIWKHILKYAAVFIGIVSVSYFYKTKLLDTNKIVVKTTFGEQKNIHLSDGSIVWLNASSTLSYNKKTPRTLYLVGEGFFEVAKDKLHPFTVTTLDDITVKALGTSFNVKSYKDSQITETKLLTGKVEVSSDKLFKDFLIMIPNDKITYYRDTKKVVKGKMDANDIRIAWKEGEIQFNNMVFKEIAMDLKSQYNIKIKFNNESIANSTFTGSFDNTTPIDEIFEILKMSKDFNYKLNTETNEWVIK